MIIMMIGLGMFQKALDESGKETFTREDLIPLHAKALADFCASFSERKQNSQNWEFFLSLVFRKEISFKFNNI